MKLFFLALLELLLISSMSSPAWSFDEQKPVEIHRGFFKTQISQNGQNLSNEDFVPALDTLAEANDLIESSETTWDIGYGLALASPFALIYGISANSTNPQTGVNSMVAGAVAGSLGVYLLHLSSNWRARAGDIYNEDRTTKKPIRRMYMLPTLAAADHFGMSLKIEF